MNETTNRTAPASIMEMCESAVAAVMNMVAQGNVGDALPQSLHSSLADTSVRTARFRVCGSKPGYSFAHFVWIMVERSRVNGTAAHFADSQGNDRSVQEPLENEEDGLCVRTNDMDLMVGYPPSYFGHAPVRYTAGFAKHVCEFLADNLRNLQDAEILLQIEIENGQVINLITDSTRGWNELRTLSHCV